MRIKQRLKTIDRFKINEYYVTISTLIKLIGGAGRLRDTHGIYVGELQREHECVFQRTILLLSYDPNKSDCGLTLVT